MLYSKHVVEPAPAWIDVATWRGAFSIQSDTDAEDRAEDWTMHR